MNASRRAIAHAVRDEEGNWRPAHDLADHLVGVANRAACFARAFGEDWARIAGLWHDLGKYRPAFQQYIRNRSGFDRENAHIETAPHRVEHSAARALHAIEQFGEPAGRLLAYLIAGHQSGLPDWNGDTASLLQRIESARHDGQLQEVLRESPPHSILDASMPQTLPKDATAERNELHFWLRMLFSCLVDADFLDTEAYMDPRQAVLRSPEEDVVSLLARLMGHVERLSREAVPTTVNQIRSRVLAQCIARASGERGSGLFSLTVPTGGGKTLSSLAFALHHAVEHGKRRVIYAIPYLSIIEQTADVFRGIFGEHVVEHHSNLDPAEESARTRLAAENWDAPLIVTTNVQFFESLYAAKPSRCRKLHNIVDSVVILDEAQLLPPGFLDPCLAAIRALSRHYGVTFVLCTATQPAFQPRQIDGRPFDGLPGMREIMAGGPHVSDPTGLYRGLERVQIHWPDPRKSTGWDELAIQVAGSPEALTIVNRKAHARELASRLPGSLYLSTDLCGAHRASRIEEIRRRLAANRERVASGLPVEPLHVVSTQLVEAGVDIDFPVVFRALAGLDAIAQAAGRCNREGRVGRGEVRVFIPPEPSPSGLLLKGEQATRQLLALDANPALLPESFDHYFRLWYHSLNSRDEQRVLRDLRCGSELDIAFRTAAEKFRLIPDDTLPVVVRWGQAAEWLDRLGESRPDRWLMRRLQRHTVSVHRDCLERLLVQGDVRQLSIGLFVQANDFLYDEAHGFIGSAAGVLSAPSSWIV